jgi:hypothetical protein
VAVEIAEHAAAAVEVEQHRQRALVVHTGTAGFQALSRSERCCQFE